MQMLIIAKLFDSKRKHTRTHTYIHTHTQAGRQWRVVKKIQVNKRVCLDSLNKVGKRTQVGLVGGGDTRAAKTANKCMHTHLYARSLFPRPHFSPLPPLSLPHIPPFFLPSSSFLCFLFSSSSDSLPQFLLSFFRSPYLSFFLSFFLSSPFTLSFFFCSPSFFFSFSY